MARQQPCKRTLSLALVVMASALLTACAGNQPAAEKSERAEYDPWEPLNRRVYNFNVAIDKVSVKPLAKGYKAITPRFMRRGVTNFFDNLTTPRSSVNNFLQGKPKRGFTELGRFVVNSTVGLGGLINITDINGTERHDETFSQTFAVWGVPEGPYVMLPIFGPHSLLDAASLPFDFYTNLLERYENTSVRSKLNVLLIIDARQRLLAADRFLDDSKDPYITFREAYLQNREYEIYDGEPPDEEDYYEFFDDEEFDMGD